MADFVQRHLVFLQMNERCQPRVHRDVEQISRSPSRNGTLRRTSCLLDPIKQHLINQSINQIVLGLPPGSGIGLAAKSRDCCFHRTRILFGRKRCGRRMDPSHRHLFRLILCSAFSNGTKIWCVILSELYLRTCIFLHLPLLLISAAFPTQLRSSGRPCNIFDVEAIMRVSFDCTILRLPLLASHHTSTSRYFLHLCF